MIKIQKLGEGKSRWRKFRGRTYQGMLWDLLDEEWQRKIEVVLEYHKASEKLFERVKETELHSIDITTHYAGWAWYQYNRVDVHHSLFGTEHFENTLIHELCHLLVTWLVSDRVGHGKPWKKMMVLFDQDPSRCHSLGLLKGIGEDKVKTYKYACTSCGKEWERHRPLRNFENRYHKCGGSKTGNIRRL